MMSKTATARLSIKMLLSKFPRIMFSCDEMENRVDLRKIKK